MRLLKDLICICCYAVAEFFERLARGCEDQGPDPQTQKLISEIAASN